MQHSRFFTAIAVFLLIGLGFLSLSQRPVLAADGPTINHRFYLELPNGAKKPLLGASVHYLTNTNEDNPDTWEVLNGCHYEVDGETVQRPGGLALDCDPNDAQCHMCETWNSCYTKDFGGPYLPPSYNSAEKIYSYADARLDTSYAYFNGETFVTMLQREFAPISTLYTNTIFRGFPNAKWRGTVDYSEGGSLSIIDTEEEMQEFTQALSSSGLENEWNSGVAMSQFTDPARWQMGELFRKSTGGNALHGGIMWTLQVESPPVTNVPPQCNGFNTYTSGDSSQQGETILGPTATLNKNETITIKQANADEEGTPDKQEICWSANGLAADKYQNGATSIACAPTCINAGDQAQLNQVTTTRNGARVNLPFSDFGITSSCDPIVASEKKLRGSLTAQLDQLINALPEEVQEQAKTSGLVFMQRAWNSGDNGNQFCTTNPGFSESGAIWNGGGSNVVLDTNCGKRSEPQGLSDAEANCTRRVTFIEKTPPPALKCNSISFSNQYPKPTEINTLVGFVCGQVDTATSYEFRVTDPSGKVTPLLADSKAITNSRPYTVSATGSYTAECRPCNNAGCAAWGSSSCTTSFTIAGDTPTGEIMCKEKGKVAYLVDKDNKLILLTPDSQVPRKSIVEYHVTITNNGAALAQPGIVEDTLDFANVEYIQGSFLPTKNFVSYTEATGKLRFSIPVVANSTNLVNPATTVSYRVKVLDKPQPTTIPNKITIIDNGKGQTVATTCRADFKRETQGAASCQEKVAYDKNGAPLISNTSAPVYVAQGSVVNYELTLFASAPTSGEVSTVDVLPAKLDLVSVALDGGTALTEPKADSFFRASQGQADGSTKLTFVVPTFGTQDAAGEKHVIKIATKVKDAATVGTFTNTATVTTAGSTGSSTCSHVLAVPPAGVAACTAKEMYTVNGTTIGTRIADQSTLNTGTEYFYQVKVAATSQTAGEVMVTDTIPGGITLTDKGDFDSYDQATGKLTKKLAAFSGEKTLKFKVKIADTAQSGTIQNTAYVTTVDGAGNAIGSATSCAARLTVPYYECNTSCSANTQCQSKNADYICASDQGNRCRLKQNVSSETCQAQGYYCNSTCDSVSQCESVNSNYTCADTSDGKRCRLKTNTSDTSCTASTTTPTPTPTVGCNSTCLNNADCSNPQHVCYEGKCRLSSNVTSTSCTTQTTAQSSGQPQPPTELPQTGPADWGNWLKAGAVVLGVGALLLLLL